MYVDKRKCLECGAKIPGRWSPASRRKQFTNVCQYCFTHPPDEHRCHATTTKGTRCSFRITGESKKLCKLHARREKK